MKKSLCHRSEDKMNMFLSESSRVPTRTQIESLWPYVACTDLMHMHTEKIIWMHLPHGPDAQSRNACRLCDSLFLRHTLAIGYTSKAPDFIEFDCQSSCPSADQICFPNPLLVAERAAQTLHVPPGPHAASYLGFPLMHIPCQLTGVLPPHNRLAESANLIRMPVAIACGMPLGSDLQCIDSQRIAWTHQMPPLRAIGAAIPLALLIASTLTNWGLPFVRMCASRWSLLAVVAHPHRHNPAAAGHLVKIDVAVLCGVQLLNELRVFIL